MIVVCRCCGSEGVDEAIEQLAVSAMELALERHGRTDAEVGLRLTGDEELRMLNRCWRGIDAPTDVLAFPMEEDGPAAPGEPVLLGDVVVSCERARRQAELYGHSLAREICYLAVHGTLHLLGYDDADSDGEVAMAREAEAVLAALGIGR